MTRPQRRIGAIALAAASVPACSGNMGALDPQADESRDVAVLWWAMVAAGTAVFVLVVVLLVWAARGRRADDDDVDLDSGSRRLVLYGGIVLPVVVLVPLAIGMLAVGTRVANRVGDADLEVHVTGHMFWWEVRYPGHDVVTANELHLPVDREVLLILDTQDVIHAFWVPQLTGKIDMIPGNTTELRFTPRTEGEFVGICAEFCGLQHARMRKLAIVQSQADFDDWIESQRAPAREPRTDAQRRGLAVYGDVGCASCHNIHGAFENDVMGPDLTHLASRSSLAAMTIPNTREHLAEWIVDPQARKPGNLMPPTPIDPQQLEDLLDYLEALE